MNRKDIIEGSEELRSIAKIYNLQDNSKIMRKSFSKPNLKHQHSNKGLILQDHKTISMPITNDKTNFGVGSSIHMNKNN